MPKDRVPMMQTFIQDVHVPRPIDGQDGYWDGYEMGAMRARQDLIFSLLAMRELSNLSTQQVVSLAKELRGQQNTGEVAAQASRETLAAAMPQIANLVRDAAVASSPNPFQAMMAQAMQPLFSQALANLMTLFQPKAQLGQESGQPPAQALGQQPQAQQPVWSPPNIEQHSIEEWEG